MSAAYAVHVPDALATPSLTIALRRALRSVGRHLLRVDVRPSAEGRWLLYAIPRSLPFPEMVPASDGSPEALQLAARRLARRVRDRLRPMTFPGEAPQGAS